MATSSKVGFDLQTLKEKALEAIDFRIAQVQEQLDLLRTAGEHERAMQEWRSRQLLRVIQLHDKLLKDELDNLTLSEFKIDKLPQEDRWSIQEAERTLARLNADRVQMVAKAESLVADADGVIHLTKTQLQEFFKL